MEAEMQEAQTALGKKHTMMQEAIDQVGDLESTIAAKDEQLEHSAEELQNAHSQMASQKAVFESRQAELESVIVAKERAIQERNVLLAARRDTEAKLHKEATELISTLDASVADGLRMHAELETLAAAEEARRATTREVCESTATSLTALQTDTAAFAAEAQARQEQLTALTEVITPSNLAVHP
jgi:chromosome segregation ATPase